MLGDLRSLLTGALIFSAVSLFAAQAAAAQQTASINVSSPVVQPGGNVTVYGNAGACQTGDQSPCSRPRSPQRNGGRG